jgi:hypothetical protein
MIDLTRALAHFGRSQTIIRIALEGDKQLARVGPTLKLLDGHLVAGLAGRVVYRESTGLKTRGRDARRGSGGLTRPTKSR